MITSFLLIKFKRFYSATLALAHLFWRTVWSVWNICSQHAINPHSEDSGACHEGTRERARETALVINHSMWSCVCNLWVWLGWCEWAQKDLFCPVHLRLITQTLNSQTNTSLISCIALHFYICTCSSISAEIDHWSTHVWLNWDLCHRQKKKVREQVALFEAFRLHMLCSHLRHFQVCRAIKLEDS